MGKESRTHKPLLTRLPSHSLDLSDLIERNAILTEQTPMHDEVSFEAVWRENSTLGRDWWLGRAYEGCQGHCTNL